MMGNIDTADYDGNESGDDEHGSNEAEFLSDDGKNKIGMMFGNKAELLAAIAETFAGDAATAQGDHGLVGLETLIATGFFEM